MVATSSFSSSLVRAGEITAVTCNVYGVSSVVHKKPKVKERAQAFRDDVIPRWRRGGDQIVVCQEMFGPFQDAFDPSSRSRNPLQKILHPPNRVSKDSSYPQYAAATERRPFIPEHSGLVTASTLPITRQQFRRFDDTCPVQMLADVGVQRVSVDHPVGSIGVYNGHFAPSLDPTNLGRYSEIRVAQQKRTLWEMFKQAIDEAEDDVVLVGGDFNHHPRVLPVVEPEPVRPSMLSRLRQSLFGTKKADLLSAVEPTAEYKTLVDEMELTDLVTVIARYRGIDPSAVNSFGHSVKLAEEGYRDYPTDMLFDRWHLKPGRSDTEIHVILDRSDVEFEDTGLSDHKAVRVRVYIEIHRRSQEAIDQKRPQVLYVYPGGSERVHFGARVLADPSFVP